MEMRFFSLVVAGLLVFGVARAQKPRQALDPTAATASRRQRLILKDGSYQVVLSYKVVGARVRFISAERNGETEEIPLDLVDLPATERWARAHAPATEEAQNAPPVLDPELMKEEAERAALTPEVAPDLRLEPEDAVLALDTWHGAPELVPMNQAETDLNKQTGHSILRGKVNPRAASHQIVLLRGEKADVQMHVNQPEFFVRLGDGKAAGGPALTIDTHGANASEPERKRPSGPSQYVIVRTDVRQDARVVASFDVQSVGGGGRPQGEVIDTNATPMTGGHWVKIVPKEPLLVGEYALVEILNERELNLAVWDFGVHPTAPENRDVLLPEKRRPVTLERRRVEP